MTVLGVFFDLFAIGTFECKELFFSLVTCKCWSWCYIFSKSLLNIMYYSRHLTIVQFFVWTYSSCQLKSCVLLLFLSQLKRSKKKLSTVTFHPTFYKDSVQPHTQNVIHVDLVFPPRYGNAFKIYLLFRSTVIQTFSIFIGFRCHKLSKLIARITRK